ncbi:helix-turn-helix domain-containing protein [Streptomyces flavidovirens]|uniref:AraC family transcriptional regulator n=1 Tax=Streptomyces flavidovirens TaxID=67298 RepID=UPI0036BB6E82
MRYFADPYEAWELAWARPDQRLRPGVVQYRGYRLSLGKPRRRLEVPDGAVTLVLSFDGQLRTNDIGDTSGRRAERAPGEHRSSLLSALRTRATLGEHSGRMYGMEVTLTPWAAYTLFGVAMHEWAERIIDPADLVGGRVNQLTEALACLPDWEQRFRLLDTTLGLWWEKGPAYSPRVVWAWRELLRTAGAVPIRRVSAQTGWGWRQCENRFLQQIGLPPKAVARIMRLHRALRLLSEGNTATLTALACSFSDQAHMSREIRRMTGFPPSRLLPARMPVAANPLHDRIPGQVTSFALPRSGRAGLCEILQDNTVTRPQGCVAEGAGATPARQAITMHGNHRDKGEDQ